MKEKENIEPIYTITGTVVHGRGIGKHVGTPTANIEVDEHATLPETGVYAAKILLDSQTYMVLPMLECDLHLITIKPFQSKLISLILITIYTGVL